MKKIFWICCSIVFLLQGCSDNGDDAPVETAMPVPTDLFTLKINGTEIPFFSSTFQQGDMGPYYNNLVTDVRLAGDKFIIWGTFQAKFIFVVFTPKEEFVSIKIERGGAFSDNEPYTVEYQNYPNFTSHYFNSEIHHDEANQKVSATFSGNLYAVGDNMESESIFVECEIKNQPYSFTTVAAGGERCSAKFNGVVWDGLSKDYMGDSFRSDDPYILTLSLPAPANGQYGFSPGSTSNRMTLSKFNTETLSYEAFDCTGTLTLTQIEFWGSGHMYSGTFSLTAVNPNNPSEVIQVTDGDFRWQM